MKFISNDLTPEEIQEAEERAKRVESHDKALRERLFDIYAKGGCTFAENEAGFNLFAGPGDERNSIVCGAPAVVTFNQEYPISGGISADYTIPGAVLVKSKPLKGGGWSKLFKVNAHLCASHLFRLMQLKFGPTDDQTEGRHCCMVPKSMRLEHKGCSDHEPYPGRSCLEPPIAAYHNENLCFYHLANLVSQFPNIEVEMLDGDTA